MAIIGLQKGSGKRSRVREKSVKSQGILIWIMSGNPANYHRGQRKMKLVVKFFCIFEFACFVVSTCIF